VSAYGDDPSLHGVIGVSEDDPVFVCSAPPEAPCRTYPVCDCESWGEGDEHNHLGPNEPTPGHEAKSGQPCWMGVHFDMQGVEDSGPSCGTGPVANRSRPGWHAVTVDWDDGCSWEYADPAPADLVEVEVDPIAARHSTPGPADQGFPL
jgi:hypothetical protein